MLLNCSSVQTAGFRLAKQHIAESTKLSLEVHLLNQLDPVSRARQIFVAFFSCWCQCVFSLTLPCPEDISSIMANLEMAKIIHLQMGINVNLPFDKDFFAIRISRLVPTSNVYVIDLKKSWEINIGRGSSNCKSFFHIKWKFSHCK